MFLKSAIFKRLLKEAYSGPGLRLHNDGQGMYIGGSYWGAWVKNGRIEKKELGAIIELTGELPEAGKGFLATKGGNQYEIWESIMRDVMGNATKYKRMPDVTKMLIRTKQGTLARVLQDRSTGEIMLLNEIFISLIDEKAVEQQESFPTGPLAGDAEGVYWVNDIMAFMALPVDLEYSKTGKLIENLEKFLIQEDDW